MFFPNVLECNNTYDDVGSFNAILYYFHGINGNEDPDSLIPTKSILKN
jgi:hypothetical protein